MIHLSIFFLSINFFFSIFQMQHRQRYAHSDASWFDRGWQMSSYLARLWVRPKARGIGSGTPRAFRRKVKTSRTTIRPNINSIKEVFSPFRHWRGATMAIIPVRLRTDSLSVPFHIICWSWVTYMAFSVTFLSVTTPFGWLFFFCSSTCSTGCTRFANGPGSNPSTLEDGGWWR